MTYSTPPQPANWRERWQEIKAAFRNIPRAVVLVWRAHRSSAIALGILSFLLALLPASQAWLGKLIVDGIVNATQAGLSPAAGLQQIGPYLVIGFGLVTLSAALNQGYSLLEHMLNARLSHTINEQIIEKALALDLHFFEDSEFYNKLQNARREADYRALAIINNLFAIVTNGLMLLSFAVILLAIGPLIALVLFCATLPTFIVQARYAGLTFRLLTRRAPEFRRMQYIEHLLTVDSTVKEIKLFGLGHTLLRRYQEMFWNLYHEDAALARRRSVMSVSWGMLSTASFYGAYAWVVWRTVQGSLTLGDLTLYLALFQQSQSTFRTVVSGIARLYESGLFLDNLFDYLQLQPQLSQATEPRPIPRPLQQGIEFRAVSFRYPGRTTWALHNVNLQICPGETLALVGANGAGKTTLIKLLTRLYDPTEGSILIDGVDLRDYDADDLRDRISVIFQDFVHYQSTARDNIGYGDVTHMEDDHRILHAATQSGADQVVATLPRGYDSMVGRWFAEGFELSGGEWQKMALGRALMRDAEILVLDEPTASLDPQQEHTIFQQFKQLTQGRITLLISHRFSTVRMADRIAVLSGHTLAELGTHQELLEHNGLYAHLFRLQAQGYREE